MTVLVYNVPIYSLFRFKCIVLQLSRLTFCIRIYSPVFLHHTVQENSWSGTVGLDILKLIVRAASMGARARGTGCGIRLDCPREEAQRWLASEPEQARGRGPVDSCRPECPKESDVG